MTIDSKIEEGFRLNDLQKVALKKLGIKTVEDLLYHFPTRYGEQSDTKNIASLKEGDMAEVYGEIRKLKTSKAYRKKIPMAEGELRDHSGKIKIVWFNQPYIAKMYSNDSLVKIEGKVTSRKDLLYISNPDIKSVNEIPRGAGDPLFENTESGDVSLPVYSESRGISSMWFYHNIQKLFGQKILDEIVDPIPENILKKYKLPKLQTAFVWIHSPKTKNDALSARKRFAFQEIFLIQIQKQQDKKHYQSKPSFKIEKSKEQIAEFAKKFPFEPTKSQKESIETILGDFKKDYAMSRLLEGDVGSGKTYVAAVTSYAVVTTPPENSSYGALQTAYMAPTEILANQLFESFIEYFKDIRIQVGLITSSGCKKFPSKVNGEKWTNISRAQLLKWVENGEIPILIGTHSLIQKTVKFKNLAYVIIDEQHRFGTNQRGTLVRGKTRMEEKSRKDADDILLYRDLSYILRGIAYDIHKELGSGHKEIVYQNALVEALNQKGLEFSREKQIDVRYNNKKVGVYQPDFIVEDKIILELKALPYTSPKERKQLWNYLKGSSYKLGFLINFGTQKVDIQRVVYDTARNPRSSALDSSAEMQALTPHFLSMTATPIPRTLALTIYGDLDLSVIDEMPKGRKPVITEIVKPTDREKAYTQVRAQLKEGHQVYVICPRIDEPDPEKEQALRVKSVKEEAKRLKSEIFPEFEIEMMHGKMKPKEKERVMKKMEEGVIDILVSTSVVEVGVNIPNATTIIIEGAERFGLAQLHQLRGRVIRSTHQPYAFIFSDTKAERTIERLSALKRAKNGFELSEYDLEFRGAGDLAGRKQWGITDLGMEAIRNLKMVEAARTEATKLIESDPDLKNTPKIKAQIEKRGEVHFE
jgi:GxxExxY protein